MKHVAVVAVAMECIAAAAQIDQSYSPGGANVHTYIWFLGPHGFTTEKYLDLFRLICKANLFSDPQILRFRIFLSWPDTPQKCLNFFPGGSGPLKYKIHWAVSILPQTATRSVQPFS